MGINSEAFYFRYSRLILLRIEHCLTQIQKNTPLAVIQYFSKHLQSEEALKYWEKVSLSGSAGSRLD